MKQLVKKLREELKNNIRYLNHLMLAIFGLVSVFGVYVCMGLFTDMTMPMDVVAMTHTSATVDCGHSEAQKTAGMCPMSIMEHLGNWQHFFNVIFVSDLLLLVAMVCIAIIALGFSRANGFANSPPWIERMLLYGRRQRMDKLYDYFSLIFSEGILQPKLFA